MTSYDLAISAFNSILGIQGRTFGQATSSSKGVSDDNQGVQWNIGVNKETGNVWLGVNLEGKIYDNWPIATLILKEIEKPTLHLLARTLRENDKVRINFSRDAWQVTSRPPILENDIQHCGILASQITEIIWKEMLNEAIDCLDPMRDRRGRSKQMVTLKSTGVRKEMEVSPHLGFATDAWLVKPENLESARYMLQEAFSRLEPLYDFVKEITGDLKFEYIHPDELNEPEELYEGCKKTVTVNAYERNPLARKKCIEHYGAKCAVPNCQFDFEKVYGDIGKGFIHVHHLTKLADIGQDYKVDPIKDLRPVCPNCHAMLHQKNPPYSIEELIPDYNQYR